jgi:hypothetical protein
MVAIGQDDGVLWILSMRDKSFRESNPSSLVVQPLQQSYTEQATLCACKKLNKIVSQKPISPEPAGWKTQTFRVVWFKDISYVDGG